MMTMMPPPQGQGGRWSEVSSAAGPAEHAAGTANELVGGQGHDLLSVDAGAAVILVAEGDAGLVEGDKAAVRDRHAVGGAREIGENGFRSGEGRFGINNPTGTTIFM
jgi:Ca2+-binding RTX toxin-like protein